MVNEGFKDLYTGFLHDLRLIWEGTAPEAGRAESCIRCGMRYWERLKEAVAQRPFRNKKEEIDFFKQVKPKFIGRIEYFTLIFEASLFCPTEDAGAMHVFWEKERQQIARFRKEREEIISYYEVGGTHWDEEYLQQSPDEAVEPALNRIYDPEGCLSSPMDGPLAMMVAYELYEGYLNEKGQSNEKNHEKK